MYVEELRKDALADLAEEDAEEPCKAVHAVALLEALGFGDDAIRGEGGWKKLAGRPCGKVREFSGYAKGHKQEQRQHLLTMFARRVPAVS